MEERLTALMKEIQERFDKIESRLERLENEMKSCKLRPAERAAIRRFVPIGGKRY
jgi:hypothetical protein